MVHAVSVLLHQLFQAVCQNNFVLMALVMEVCLGTEHIFVCVCLIVRGTFENIHLKVAL